MVHKVHKWREALHLIANLSGLDSRHCVDEAVMVGEIARDISRRVTLMQKIDSGNIVGMKAHMEATRLSHGLPSAIQAHALFLRGRTAAPEVWEEALTALESSLDENTMEILKISYEGLPKPHQNVFLHVACLFNGDTLQRINSLLHGPIPQSSLWIRVLAEKSLIKISTNGSVIMHKLVEQMAREMIRDDTSLARKFLRDPQDICYALTNFRDGGEQTECMSLHSCNLACAFSMKASVVGHMHNLKFLKVYKHVDSRESKLQLIPDQHLLPPSLRLFHWDAFPLRTLPSDADPYFLVELNLRHSDLETLWSGTPMMESLKRLDVTGSKHLKQLPDLSGITSLEELALEHCTRLKGIPESIGKRSSIKKLKLSYCGGLRSALKFFVRKPTMQQHIGLEFPDAKVKMDALINISIGGDISFEFCSKFRGTAEYVSFNSDQQIPVTSSMNLQQSPWLISECNRFNSLSIMRFSHKENGESFSFDSFPDFPDLKELKLVNLNIRKIPSGVHGIHKLEFIEKLDLSGNDFESLPEAMVSLTRLKTLWLRNCFKLKELPKLTQVQTLTLTNCRNLRSLVKLSETKNIEVEEDLTSSDHERNEITEARNKHRKVLHVADGVKDSEQGQWIKEYANWFAPGSRIILITQDKSVLEESEVNHVQPYPPPEFECLSVQVKRNGKLHFLNSVQRKAKIKPQWK
ncbi:hypothetical protein YC2023_111864 [Brassica napus]